MKIGIIGLGQFGWLMGEILARDPQLELLAYDTAKIDPPEGVTMVSLQDVAQADILLLCVPLTAYQPLCEQLKPLLSSSCVVVDVASVKIEAVRRLRALLPGHKNFLFTHPMFGPLYAKNGLEGLTLVVTEVEGARAQEVIDYCDETLGLKIVRITGEEHDREMAEVHALTYLIARALTDYDLPGSKISTPTFRMLHEIMRYDKAHSEELFRTIQLGNPFARAVREKFVKTMVDINEKLDEEKI